MFNVYNTIEENVENMENPQAIDYQYQIFRELNDTIFHGGDESEFKDELVQNCLGDNYLQEAGIK